MAVAEVLKLIEENDIRFVDLRFTDTLGKEQHVSVPTTVGMKTGLKEAMLLMALLSWVGRVSKLQICY